MIEKQLQNGIEQNAGMIWNLLLRKRVMTVEDLKFTTHCDEGFILLSLGWLAREEKVLFSEVDGFLAVELNQRNSSLHFF